MPDQPYTGSTITIKLPVPLDPSTLDVWAGQLEQQAFVPIAAAINQIIRYLNGDTTPPTPVVPPAVAISNPTANTVLQGLLVVTARTSGVTAISAVTAFIDGVRLGSMTVDTTGTWTLPAFNTAAYADGSHQISVQAVDSLGNVGSDTVTVLTVNTTTTPVPDGDLLGTETGDQLATETGDVFLIETSTASASDAITTEAGDPLATESADILIHE